MAIQWVHSINNRSHTSQFIVLVGIERNFLIKMTGEKSLVQREAIKAGYDLHISAKGGVWEKIKHGKTVKELKQYVEDEYGMLKMTKVPNNELSGKRSLSD